jgi:serine phosphatase RsbU (regulator of sigma subunit)
VQIDETQAHALEQPWSSASFERMTLSHHAVSADGHPKGGDWCETFALGASRLAISIGDVCGHGAAASDVMVGIRHDIRSEARGTTDPARVLHAVNERLCLDRFATHATSIFAVIDVPTQTLAFANAGHPAPLLMENCRSRFLRRERGDMPIGIQPSLQISTHRIELSPDALVVFYTDGIVELERDAGLGERRLREAVRIAYHAPGVAAADAIAIRLQLARRRHEDASILTIRTARTA